MNYATESVNNYKYHQQAQKLTKRGSYFRSDILLDNILPCDDTHIKRIHKVKGKSITSVTILLTFIFSVRKELWFQHLIEFDQALIVVLACKCDRSRSFSQQNVHIPIGTRFFCAISAKSVIFFHVNSVTMKLL